MIWLFYKENTCLCLCAVNNLTLISNSSLCNTLCEHSINNGECGGDPFFSVYQKVNVTLPEEFFGGFCLTCQSTSSKKLLSSRECNADADGYCVMSNGNGNRKTHMSTFDAYWERCRKQNLYIVGDVEKICSYSARNIWTGLRKYKIDNIKNESRCYSIEIKKDTISYEERSCTERHSLLCKQDIAQTDVYSTDQIKSTTKSVRPQLSLDILSSTNDQNTSPRSKRSTSTITPVISLTSWKPTKSDLAISHTTDTPSSELDENKTTVIGASIAGIVVVTSVVFLILCFIKRRNLQCLQSNQQGKRPNVFDNSTYDDNIVKNQGHDHIVNNTTPAYNNNQGRMDEEDGIYVEKQEEEYDHLHSSRQKHITKDTKDNEYGTASYLEDDSYSTLRQGRNSNPEPDLDNKYSTMPSLENNGSSMGNPEYDFCYQMDQRKDW